MVRLSSLWRSRVRTATADSAKPLRVRMDLPHCLRHLLHRGVSLQQNRMMQHHHAVMSALSLRQGTGTSPAAGRTTDVQCAKAFIERYALGSQGSQEVFTTEAELLRLELKAQLVIHRLTFLVVAIAKRQQPRHVAQVMAQLRNASRPSAVAFSQAIQLRQQDCGLKFREGTNLV